MFKHILVATDGSPLADKAVAMAMQLSSLSGSCRVSALMVVPDYSMSDSAKAVFGRGAEGLTGEIDQLRRRLGEAGAERLEAALRRHRAPQVPLDALVAVSDYPYDEILQHAERLKCDLIVMASHGHGAVMSAVMQSQTAHVLAQAKVPVLVVR